LTINICNFQTVEDEREVYRPFQIKLMPALACRSSTISPVPMLFHNRPNTRRAAYTRLPRYTNQTISELTPANWQKARVSSPDQYAAAA